MLVPVDGKMEGPSKTNKKKKNLLEAEGDLRHAQTSAFAKCIILKGYEYLCQAP